MREILITFLVMVLHCSLQGQVFLQLERSESTEVKKFFAGDQLKYKTTEIDRWQKGIILQVIPDGSSILFEDELLSLGDITRIELKRPAVEAIGKSLMIFGISWIVMGGAIEGLRQVNALETDYEFGWDTLAIGASSAGIGYLIDRFLSHDRRKINGTNRLRILDITF